MGGGAIASALMDEPAAEAGGDADSDSTFISTGTGASTGAGAVAVEGADAGAGGFAIVETVPSGLEPTESSARFAR